MESYGRLTDTFLELVKIDSESKNERRICDYIKKCLENYISKMVEDDTGAKIGGNCGNLIATIEGNTPGAPAIMLNAHMDSVKPANGIVPVVDGDIIKSEGKTVLGADDKAGIAVIIETVRILKEENRPHGDLQLVITVSEETGLLGARFIDPSLLKADYGFALDCIGPAGVIYNASPSHDTLKTTVTGRAAHAGMEPEKGISAIQVASRAISNMKLGRIDDETTANVGVIRGGYATNIVPDTVSVESEARSHDPEKLKQQIEHMRDALEAAADEVKAKVETTLTHEYRSYHIKKDAPVIQAISEAARRIGAEPVIAASGGGSDANMFNKYGVPTVPIGTAMRKCHTTDEYIHRSELEEILKWVLAAVEK